MKTHLKKYRLQYILGIIFLLFIAGVSFKQILDRTKITRKSKIEYIVIHYTANPNSGATAEMNAIYLKNKERAGTHYCIDDEEIIQCTDEQNVAYAVGDKKWLGFIPKPWLKNKVTNNNSISYEMCLGGGRNDSVIVDITAQAVAWQILNKGFYHSTVKSLSVWSAGQNKSVIYTKKVIVPDLGRIVRHHDVSGKHCPRFYYMDTAWDQTKEDRAFYKFKLKVDKYVQQKLKNEVQ